MSEFHLHDRWDNPIRVLNDVVRTRHNQEINAEDALILTTETPLNKGERIVWSDDYGVWHEHVVDNPVDIREDNQPYCESYCEDALNEVWKDIIDEKRFTNATSSSVLSAVLETTRWKVGRVTVTGANSTVLYHCSVGEALQGLIETWGGEIYASYAVDDEGITARYVNWVPSRGNDSGKRFEYAKDLVSISQSVESGDVYTAMRGFGKGEEVGDGKGRRIDFAAINGGKNYVEDATAKALWGRPDGKGGVENAFGTVVFEDCEDPVELLRLTEEALKRVIEPKVSYSAQVIHLKAAGFDCEGVQIGDTVAIVDSTFSPELRLKGRILRIEWDLDNPNNTKITVGNISNNVAKYSASVSFALKAMQDRAANWDVAASTPSSYLNQILKGLNNEFIAGQSYIWESPDQGIIISNVPLDTDGKPADADKKQARAMQLRGGEFRIANGINSVGEFDWTTFGTGEGFTANNINAGTIQGGSNYWNLETGDLLFKQGSIASADGKNSWNLGTGSLRLGKGVISSSNGNNFWDLDTGVFQTTGTVGGIAFTLVLSPTDGLKIYSGGSLIGGLSIVNGVLSLIANKLKDPRDIGYLTCGVIDNGNLRAFEYVTGSESGSFMLDENFGILPLYNSSSGKMQGYGRMYNRKFHEVIRNSIDAKGFRLGFRGTEIDPDKPSTLTVEAPYVYASETIAGIKLADNWEFWIRKGDPSGKDGFFANCGGKGFAYRPGEGFFEDIPFS